MLLPSSIVDACGFGDRQGSIGLLPRLLPGTRSFDCMIPNAFSWSGQKARKDCCQSRFPQSLASSCRIIISTRPMLKLSPANLCSRKCFWITRASRARRYVLSSVIYACSHYRSVGRRKAAWWMSVNLTSVQRSDRAPDQGRFGRADAFLAIGSRRTTQVKRELDAKVPQVVAQEPPPR